LEAEPELRGIAEVPGETESGVRRDAADTKHNLVDAAWRHAYFEGKAVLAQFHRFQEFFQEYLAGMNWFQFTGHVDRFP
jgi:hypothetical protein